MESSTIMIISTIVSAISTILVAIFIWVIQRFVKTVDTLVEKVGELTINAATNGVMCAAKHESISKHLELHDADINSLKSITERHDRFIDKLKD